MTESSAHSCVFFPSVLQTAVRNCVGKSRTQHPHGPRFPTVAPNKSPRRATRCGACVEKRQCVPRFNVHCDFVPTDAERLHRGNISVRSLPVVMIAMRPRKSAPPLFHNVYRGVVCCVGYTGFASPTLKMRLPFAQTTGGRIQLAVGTLRDDGAIYS